MAEQKLTEKCIAAAHRIRCRIIEMTYQTGKTGAHIGGSLSMAELLSGIYAGILKFQPNNPNWEGRDRIILSKGHAAMALYAAMTEAGIIQERELETFKRDGSRLGAHPSLNGLPGIEFASGSLGQGLSLGVGVSLALKMKGNQNSRVFVFLGDGECNEGSVWEAAACAAQYGLNKLIAVIDMNSIQYDGYTKHILNMEPMEKKWQDFGWESISIDGHNMEEVLDAYNHLCNKPTVIIAHTIKGKGVSFMENNWMYHNAVLSKEQYEKANMELEMNR